MRRDSKPVIKCDCQNCDWYVHDSNHKNCFWVLSEDLQDNPMSVEEIAQIEGISVEEVEKITNEALMKLRNNPDARDMLQKMRESYTED
jgi:hypothetical protein